MLSRVKMDPPNKSGDDKKGRRLEAVFGRAVDSSIPVIARLTGQSMPFKNEDGSPVPPTGWQASWRMTREEEAFIP
jgi:hypothetical protein